MSKRGVLAVLVALVSTLYAAWPSIEIYLGRFFRDVARSKAHKRLYGNQYALVTMMMGNDMPVLSYDEANESVTYDELISANGEEGAPIWLSIKGRVYDVSASPNFYGPGRPYSKLVAKDATRAFGLGCAAERCLVSDIEGLNERQLKEIDRWIELYETHDKYTFVGLLETSNLVDEILDAEDA